MARPAREAAKRAQAGTCELIRPLQSCNIPAASKGRNPDISAIDDFFLSFWSLDGGCFKNAIRSHRLGRRPFRRICNNHSCEYRVDCWLIYSALKPTVQQPFPSRTKHAVAFWPIATFQRGPVRPRFALNASLTLVRATAGDWRR